MCVDLTLDLKGTGDEDDEKFVDPIILKYPRGVVRCASR